ncbi:hypothetical protein [Inquilinus limosus]|uniref:hypothetical protein n=1 Tax=Inquilinus limosus TaxID=171674 RepID=UPI00040B20DD|nr:hypothetical protein [Inquilinus limosus]
MNLAPFPISGDLLECIRACRRSPFLTRLCLVALRAINEGRDFVADVDELLADYQVGMVDAGIDPQKAAATLSEQRAMILDEWDRCTTAAGHGGA